MSSSNEPNHLYPQYAVNSGSLRSSHSKYSPSISSRKEVFVNAAYENSEFGGESTSHDYDDLQYVVAQVQQINGARRKVNELYEPTGSLHHRVRQITECSDDSTASSGSSIGYFSTKESCLSRLILFLILVVSFTALILVILIINGTLGPKGCGCNHVVQEKIQSAPRTEVSGSLDTLLTRIRELERNMSTLYERMGTRDKAVKTFVTKHESKVRAIQTQILVQKKMINYTANKMATVDGVWVNVTSSTREALKKLDLKTRQASAKINVSVESWKEKLSTLNRTIKALNENQDITTNELRKHQIISMAMIKRLAKNVTQLESHVQGLRTNSSNAISKVKSLEERYKLMNASAILRQAVNNRQNATLEDLQNLWRSLGDSLAKVNTSLNRKLKALSGSTGSEVSGNFSLCQSKEIKGTPASGGKGANAIVEYIEPTNMRVVGATCSTDYAIDYKLTISKLTKNIIYKCNCEGMYSQVSSSKIQCILFVWECPI